MIFASIDIQYIGVSLLFFHSKRKRCLSSHVQIARRSPCSLIKRKACFPRSSAPASRLWRFSWFVSCSVQGAHPTRTSRARSNRFKSFQNQTAPKLKSTATTWAMPQRRSKLRSHRTDGFGGIQLSKRIPRTRVISRSKHSTVSPAGRSAI